MVLKFGADVTVYYFQVYVGNEGTAEQGLGSRVVKDASKDILDKGYHIFLLLSSLTLANDFLKKTYSTATVLPNRKHLPAFSKRQRI